MRAEKKTGTDFDGITEATNKLLASGYHNVFSDPREKIQMRIKVCVCTRPHAPCAVRESGTHTVYPMPCRALLHAGTEMSSELARGLSAD